MKNFCLTVLILSFSLNTFSQISKMYLNDKGQLVSDPKKATCYALIEKMQDSVYMAQVYDMKDIILLKGTYKDKFITQPSGKFFYYYQNLVYTTTNNVAHTDTVVFVQCTGYYMNGLKEGTWVEFSRDGNKTSSFVFVNDKLNGLQQYFDRNGRVIKKGNYVNDKKEGMWDYYENDDFDKPTYSEEYIDGKNIHQINHFTYAKPSPALNSYVKKSLGKYIDSLKGISLQLVLNEDGKVQDLAANKKISNDMKGAFENIFSNAPNFQPFLYDGKPVKQTYAYNFSFITSNAAEAFEDMRNGERLKSYSKHTDLIGRGLNTVGFGKPVIDDDAMPSHTPRL